MHHPLLLCLSATVFLSLYVPSTSAKCRGPWAIHACYGANGKRSGPPPRPSDDARDGIMLRNILLRTNEESKPNSNDIDEYLSILPSDFDSNSDERVAPIVSSSSNSKWSNADLQGLSKLVDEFIYRKKLRNMAENEYI